VKTVYLIEDDNHILIFKLGENQSSMNSTISSVRKVFRHAKDYEYDRKRI
jgi:hypothetical protein